MIPFLSSAGGNCQDAVILVEDFADTVKPSGAFEGSTVEQQLSSTIITTVTAKSFYSRQNQFCHGKINFSSWQNLIFTHGKIFITAKSISPQQNHFHSRQNQNLTMAKSFWLTCSRDISSQSAMGIGNSEE